MKDVHTKIQEGLLSGFDDIAKSTDDIIDIDVINTKLHSRENDNDFWKWFKNNQKKIESNVSSGTFNKDIDTWGDITEKDINYSDTKDGFEFFTTSSFYLGENTKKEMLPLFGNAGVDVVRANGIIIDQKNITKDSVFKKLISDTLSNWKSLPVYIQDVRNIDGLDLTIKHEKIASKIVIDSFYPKITIKNTNILFDLPNTTQSCIVFKNPNIPDLSQLWSNCGQLGFFYEDIFESKNNPFEKLFDWTYVWNDPKSGKDIKVNSFSVLKRIINQVRSVKSIRNKKREKIMRYHYNQNRYTELMSELGTYNPTQPTIIKDGVKLSDEFKLNTLPDVHTIFMTDGDIDVVVTKDPKTKTSWAGNYGSVSVGLIYIGETADGWYVGVGSDKGKGKSELNNW